MGRRAVELARKEDRRAGGETAATRETPACWFDSTAEERERSRLIAEAMRKLPEMYREVITLKVWGGLTFREIAETLELTANTAASRYRYALVEMHKSLPASLAYITTIQNYL